MTTTRLPKWRARGILVALAIGALACGGNSEGHGRSAHGGDAGAPGLGGGGAGGSGTGGTGTPSGGACAEEPLYAELPGDVGCYAHEAAGWRKIPCNCELWVRNPHPSDAEVRLTLAVSGGDPPSLEENPDVEVAFDDADGRWFDAWSAGAASDFSVAHDGSETNVRLGGSSVTLGAVPIGGCESRTGVATIVGSARLTLDMQAAMSDDRGNTLPESSGSCFQPIRP